MAISAEVYLLFENYVKQFSPVHGAVDFDHLKPFIITAQDKHIESYLGTDLIQKVKTDAAAGTITGVYATLLDSYIRKALMWWTLYEATPFLHIKIDNGSIVVRTSEDTQPVTPDELQTVKSHIRSNAEYYSKRMKTYVDANTASFPEYTSNVWPDRSPMNPGYRQVPAEFGRNNRRDSNEGIPPRWAYTPR